MKLKYSQFSLRAIFIAITLIAIWLGYHVNWIRERHESLKWLDEHTFPSSGQSQSHRSLPWTLRVLGEKPLKPTVLIAPAANEQTVLAEYQQQVDQIVSLFPEVEILDLGKLVDQLPEVDDVQLGFPTAEGWQRILKDKRNVASPPTAP